MKTFDLKISILNVSTLKGTENLKSLEAAIAEAKANVLADEKFCQTTKSDTFFHTTVT